MLIRKAKTKTDSSPPLKQISLLDHQVDFITDTSVDIIGLTGGFRAGKTYAFVHKAFYLCQKNPGLHGAMCEPIQSMIRGTLMPVVQKVISELGWIEGKHFKYKKSNPECIEVYFPEGTSIIYLCGAENYHRLAGKTLAWFGIDEIDRCRDKEVAIAAFNECVARKTSGPCTQGFVTSTPEGFHFMHHYFVKNAFDENVVDEHGKPLRRTDRRMIVASTYQNPYVPDSYIENIKANYTPKQAEAYLRGEFINLASGNVYYQFDRHANSTNKTLEDFPNRRLHVGMDFNVDRVNAVVSVIDDNGVVYVLKQHEEKTVEQMILTLKADYHKQWRNKAILLYPDSSGKNRNASGISVSYIAQLQQAGFKCNFRGNNPSVVKERVPAVNAIFKSGLGIRCYINVDECKTLVYGLETQGYINGEPDKSGDIDHPLDAFGYFIAYVFPAKRDGSITVING